MCQFITVKELPALGYLYNILWSVRTSDLYMKLHTELGRLWQYFVFLQKVLLSNFHNQRRVVIDSWREINSGKIQRSAKNWLRRETQGMFVDNAYLYLCFNAL